MDLLDTNILPKSDNIIGKMTEKINNSDGNSLYILKILFLITYIICITYIFIKNPLNLVTNYSSIFGFIIVIIAGFLLYYIDFKFNIAKNLIILSFFIFLSVIFYYLNLNRHLIDDYPVLMIIFSVPIIISSLFIILGIYLWFNEKSMLSSVFESIKLNKTSVFKLIALFIYVISICYIFTNNSLVKKYPSVSVVLFLLVSSIIFYINLKQSQKVDSINFIFDIIKFSFIFLFFIILSTWFFVYNPGGYIMEKISPFMFILFGISILFGILYLMLYGYAAKNATNNIVNANSTDFKEFIDNKTKFLSILKYFTVLSSFIYFITIIFQVIMNLISNYGSSSYGNLAINIIIIIILAAIVYKVITYSSLYKESPLFQLIINIIFYIPCLLVSLIDNIVKLFGLDINWKSPDSGLFKPTTTDYILLASAIILNIGYFAYPYAMVKFSKQGGKLLVNAPIYTSEEHTLSSYYELNDKSTDYDYTYAISFWVYIDAANPSMGSAQNKYTSLLNYGNKPNVLYKATDNTLMVTMDETSTAPVSTVDDTKLLDENGNRILYIKKDILLQKWNNIIINYNGGTLDIFYNGELAKSVIEVVPYMNFDVLTVGTKNGIHGGICNVNYFNESLNIQQIYYLYNLVKDNTPPISKNSEETIINIAKDVPSTMNKASFNNYGAAIKEKI
jgi:hypothetical protein